MLNEGKKSKAKWDEEGFKKIKRWEGGEKDEKEIVKKKNNNRENNLKRN